MWHPRSVFVGAVRDTVGPYGVWADSWLGLPGGAVGQPCRVDADTLQNVRRVSAPSAALPPGHGGPRPHDSLRGHEGSASRQVTATTALGKVQLGRPGHQRTGSLGLPLQPCVLEPSQGPVVCRPHDQEGRRSDQTLDIQLFMGLKTSKPAHSMDFIRGTGLRQDSVLNTGECVLGLWVCVSPSLEAQI